MLKCPKCNRSFKSEAQNHFCENPPATIDEYINEQSEDIQPRLKEIYHILKETMPTATEKITWQMPTFWQGQNIIHFAAFKKHIGLYPGDKATGVFAEKLKEYKTSKGAIQIPNNIPLPKALIKEISEWCLKENAK